MHFVKEYKEPCDAYQWYVEWLLEENKDYKNKIEQLQRKINFFLKQF
jgi:hypothetical protein